MKILLVHNAYQEAGGEDVVFDQEHELLERAGHEVLTYRRSNREIEEYSAAKRLRLVKRVIWASDSRQAFARLLRQERPELVHVHNTFMMVSPSIYSVCQEFHVPVVQTLHNYRLLCPAATFFRDGKTCEECVERSLWQGIRYGCYRDSRPATATVALMLAVHRKAGTWVHGVERYIALTEFARQKFIFGGLPADKISVKPNFVQRDPGASDGTGEYGLFVGRLAPYKGVKTLLSAWERLSTRVPLLIVGDGPLREELEARVAQSGLYCVEFRGRLPHNATQEVIKGARFLILPSQCYETFPMSIVEAFACATPVICSRLGAMQEVVADGRTGLHFAPGDAADLAQTADWAWNHADEMKALGQEARAEYERRYTAAQNYRMLMEIYQRAITPLPQNT